MPVHSSYGSLSLRLVLALLWPISIVASAEVRAESVWALTFIEVKVDAQGHAGGVLRQQASALSEHAPWPAQTMLLQEVSRPERFVLVEREKPDVSTEGVREIQSVAELLTDELTAPPDLRMNRDFGEVAPATGAKANVRANVYIVAHLDIGAPAADRARVEAALRQLAVAAHQSQGNLRFDVWQQTDRTNHFNLISGWINELSSAPSRPAARHATSDRQSGRCSALHTTNACFGVLIDYGSSSCRPTICSNDVMVRRQSLLSFGGSNCFLIFPA